jgi:hypothetical protein
VPASGKLGRGMVTAELLQPMELISGVISQVMAQPELAPLLSGFIYTSEGESMRGHLLCGSVYASEAELMTGLVLAGLQLC